MTLKERPGGSYVTLGTLPTPILVVPHLNRVTSFFMKFGMIMMMTMGYSLLIILIVILFFLLTMPHAGNWSTQPLPGDEDDVSEGSRPSSAMDDFDVDQDNYIISIIIYFLIV